MTLVAIPNVSEGRDRARIDAFAGLVEDAGATVLDLHSDPAHNRSVLTVTGPRRGLVRAMAALAAAASEIDLTLHDGVHPRVGGLDVCPIVPHDEPMSAAVDAALDVGRAIGRDARLPVYLYDAAAPGGRTLPDVRRGGLEALAARARSGLRPDFGPADVDPRRGVVCVGARGPLVAFNVWTRCDVATARAIATRVRAANGGLPGVRALGLEIEPPDRTQVSMNLTAPERAGADDAFDVIRRAARDLGARIEATELVGVPPERHMPDPDAQAARLLVRPGRSLESALRAARG